MDDTDAWMIYPQHHNWFNKLWVAELFGYSCGPAGVPVPRSGEYIVRPIYNLAGMGVGAGFQYLEIDDLTSIEPGYFWCEKFIGQHLSVSYQSTPSGFTPTEVWLSDRDNDSPLYKFSKWVKLDLDKAIAIPEQINSITDVPLINVEYIDGKVIEVHLRDSPDPKYSELIPIWADTIELGTDYSSYTWVASYDDADGHLKNPRLGFYCK